MFPIFDPTFNRFGAFARDEKESSTFFFAKETNFSQKGYKTTSNIFFPLLLKLAFHSFLTIKKRNKIIFFWRRKRKYAVDYFPGFLRGCGLGGLHVLDLLLLVRVGISFWKKVEGSSSLQISGANFANSLTVNSAYKGHISSQECTNNTQESSTIRPRGTLPEATWAKKISSFERNGELGTARDLLSSICRSSLVVISMGLFILVPGLSTWTLQTSQPQGMTRDKPAYDLE